jgi:hypothetical protein
MEYERSQLNITQLPSMFNRTAGWFTIESADRWAIYHRLQDLAIDCHCHMGQPLQVRIDSPQDLIQCWSVTRHATFQPGDRLALAARLEICWKLAIKQ